MSWRDKAKPVTEGQPSWRDRARALQAEEPQQETFEQKANRDALGKVVDTVSAGANYLDEKVMAPWRSAAGNYMETGDPQVKVYNPEYDPKTAPTYSDLYKKAGVSDQPLDLPFYTAPGSKASVSPAVALGAATGIALDPLNYVGGAGVKTGISIADDATKALSRGLKNLAEDRAAKSALGNKVANYKAISKFKGKTPDIEALRAERRAFGRHLLDDKQVGWASDIEKVGERATSSYNDSIRDLEKVEAAIDEQFPDGLVDGQKIADEILDYASKITPTEDGKAIQERLLKEAENLANARTLTFKDALGWKNSFKFEGQSPDAFKRSSDHLSRIKEIIGKEMDRAAESAAQSGDPQYQKIIEQYPEAKRRYGTYKGAAQAAAAEDTNNLKNRFISPSDYGMTGLGLGAGALASGGDLSTAAITSFLLGAANNQMRRRGSAFVARSADAIRKTMLKNPAAYSKYYRRLGIATAAPLSSIVVNHQLLMQSDPEYREQFLKDQSL